MTAPQPDTKTLVRTLREHICPNWDVQPHGGCEYCARFEDAHNAVSALAARLAEAEAERDKQRRRKLDALLRAGAAERQVATLEADVDMTNSAYNRAMRQVATLEAALLLVDECADALTEDGYAYLVAAARDALGSLPAQPASLTAEDAAYVARRATWERK